MKIDLRKVLLAGTAIVAVSAFGSSDALAQTAVDASASAEWGGDGGANADDGTVIGAQAGAAMDISGDGVTVTVTNDGVNSDGSANTNTFALGAVTDSSAANDGAIAIVTGAGAADMTVGITSAVIDGAFSMANSANDANIATTVTGALTAGSLTVNAAANATNADALTLTVGGVTTIGAGATNITANGNAGPAATLVDLNGNATFGGAVTVTGGAVHAAGSTATLALSGATNTFTGGLTLTDGAGGSAAILTMDGATQTVAGTVAGNGDINVNSTVSSTFSGTVTAGTVTIEGTGANASGIFQNTLMTAVTLGTDGAGTDTNTLTLDTQNQGYTFTGTVAGTAGEANNVAVSGGNTLTHTGGAIGAGGEVDLVAVSGTGTTLTTDQNISATNFTVASGSTLATTGGTLAGALALTGTLTLNGGDFTGDIQGGSGLINVDADATVTGNIGNTTQVTNVTVAAGADLTVTGSVNAGTITLEGANADLSMTTGNNLTGNVVATVGSQGVIDFADGDATTAISGNIGASGSTLATMAVAGNGGNVITTTGNFFVDAITSNADTWSFIGTSAQTVSGTITGGGAGAVLNVGTGATSTNATFNGLLTNFNTGLVAAGATANFAAAGNNVFGGAFTTTGRTNVGVGSTITAASFGGAGTVQIDMKDDGDGVAESDGSDSGLLASAGGIDTSGGTLHINYTGSTVAGDYTIAAGAGGTALGTITDNSAQYGSAVVVDGANDYILTVTKTSAAALGGGTNGTPGNAAVGAVLDTLSATTNPQLIAVNASLASAGSTEAFNEVLESVQPTMDGGNVVAAMNNVNSSFSIMSDRLASLRTDSVGSTGMAAGNMGNGVRAWAQAFGVHGEQDRRDNIDGYDADTYGVAVGLDSENVFENTVMGVAFSYADTEVDSNNANTTNTEVDSYQFTIYGDHDIDDRTYVNGLVAYTQSDNDTRRNNVGGVGTGLTASGEFDADQFTARAEVGRDYEYDTATITPHAMAHWSHYDPDSYTETGAGGANLSVDGDDVDIFEIGLGVDVSWLFQNSDGSHFAPEIEIGVRHDLADDSVDATSSFVGGGAAFKTTGFDPQQTSVDLGAGFTYYSTDNWELSAEYDYEWKEDYDGHAGLVRAAYRF